MWENAKFRRYISLSIFGLSAVLVLFTFIDPIWGEIFQQGIRLGPSRVSWNWTGVIVTLFIFLGTHLFRLWKVGRERMRREWKENIGAAVLTTLLAYWGVFCYSVTEVVLQINKDTRAVKVPAIRYPTTLPSHAHDRTPPRATFQPEEDLDGNRITLTTGPSPAPGYPYQSRFILTNNNQHRIADVSYRCYPQTNINQVLPGAREVVLGGVPSLRSGDSFGITCDAPGTYWIDNIQSPVLKIWISYNYGKEQKKRGFVFLGIRNSETKTYSWVPRGEATDEFEGLR